MTATDIPVGKRVRVRTLHRIWVGAIDETYPSDASVVLIDALNGERRRIDLADIVEVKVLGDA